jgi:hypothetical protein
MMNRLTQWFLSKLSRSENGNGAGDVFFYRYVLLKTRWFAVYLHEFLRSDGDRCLHDHPWSFVSIILSGGYWEEMPDGRHWRPVGSILLRRAKTAHRIELWPGTRPWSLVIVGPKVRPWGFHTVAGWKPWQKGEPNPICETD